MVQALVLYGVCVLVTRGRWWWMVKMCSSVVLHLLEGC